jgi:hypothetical protein
MSGVDRGDGAGDGSIRTTIRNGIGELQSGERLPAGRVRRAGAGRKALTERDPTLLADLKALVQTDTRGDPELPLLWTAKVCVSSRPRCVSRATRCNRSRRSRSCCTLWDRASQRGERVVVNEHRFPFDRGGTNRPAPSHRTHRPVRTILLAPPLASGLPPDGHTSVVETVLLPMDQGTPTSVGRIERCAAPFAC